MAESADGAEESARNSKISDDERAAIGLKTLAALIFLVAVILLAGWAGSAEAPALSGSAGAAAALVVAIVLIANTLAPAISERTGAISALFRTLGRLAWPLSWPISVADLALRRLVGVAAGLTLRRTWRRYAVLLLHVSPVAIIVVSGVEALQILLIPALVWAFLVVLAVMRSWLWTETQFERAAWAEGAVDTERLADLRGEASLSLLIFLSLLPIAASLLQPLGFFEFCARSDAAGSAALAACQEGGEPGLAHWYAFFAVELLRAIPFVDWPEVYGVGRATALSPAPGPGEHVVFAMRVVIDLVLLGALVHTIARVGRIARQEREFRAELRRIVDPHLENRFIRQMASSTSLKLHGAPEFIGAFWNYDPGRLRRLTGRKRPTIRAVAYHALVARDRQHKETGYLADRFAGTGGLQRESDNGLRDQIVTLLRRTDVDGSGALERQAEDASRDANDRELAVRAIHELGAEASRASLLRVVANDAAPTVRKVALIAISELVGDDIDAALRDRAGNDDNRKVRKAAIAALSARQLISG